MLNLLDQKAVKRTKTAAVVSPRRECCSPSSKVSATLPATRERQRSERETPVSGRRLFRSHTKLPRKEKKKKNVCAAP